MLSKTRSGKNIRLNFAVNGSKKNRVDIKGPETIQESQAFDKGESTATPPAKRKSDELNTLRRSDRGKNGKSSLKQFGEELRLSDKKENIEKNSMHSRIGNEGAKLGLEAVDRKRNMTLARNNKNLFKVLVIREKRTELFLSSSANCENRKRVRDSDKPLDTENGGVGKKSKKVLNENVGPASVRHLDFEEHHITGSNEGSFTIAACNQSKAELDDSVERIVSSNEHKNPHRDTAKTPCDEAENTLKRIETKCEKRMKIINQKQREAILQFNRVWEEKKKILETDHKLASAVTRLVHGPGTIVTREKLKLLAEDFAKKMEEHNLLKEIHLKDLEAKHVSARNEEKKISNGFMKVAITYSDGLNDQNQINDDNVPPSRTSISGPPQTETCNAPMVEQTSQSTDHGDVDENVLDGQMVCDETQLFEVMNKEVATDVPDSVLNGLELNNSSPSVTTIGDLPSPGQDFVHSGHMVASPDRHDPVQQNEVQTVDQTNRSTHPSDVDEVVLDGQKFSDETQLVEVINKQVATDVLELNNSSKESEKREGIGLDDAEMNQANGHGVTATGDLASPGQELVHPEHMIASPDRHGPVQQVPQEQVHINLVENRINRDVPFVLPTCQHTSYPPVFSEPLQHDIQRLRQEVEELERSQEHMRSQRKLNLEKDIQQLRDKYEAESKESESGFTLKKKELDKLQNRTVMNNKLADACRSKFIDNMPYQLTAVQKAIASDCIHELQQQFRTTVSMGPAPRSSQNVTSTPPPAVHHSSTPYPYRPFHAPQAMQDMSHSHYSRPPYIVGQNITYTPPLSVQHHPSSRPLFITPLCYPHVWSWAPHLQTYRPPPPQAYPVLHYQPLQMPQHNLVPRVRPEAQGGAQAHNWSTRGPTNHSFPQPPLQVGTIGNAQGNRTASVGAEGVVCLSDDE